MSAPHLAPVSANPRRPILSDCDPGGARVRPPKQAIRATRVCTQGARRLPRAFPPSRAEEEVGRSSGRVGAHHTIAVQHESRVSAADGYSRFAQLNVDE